jgi:hypothetical protein
VKLSDVMSGANLSIYAEVALVLFLAVFAAVAVRLFLGPSDPNPARLPLEQDSTEVE